MSQALTPYYDKNVQCLLCETNFKTRKIRTRFSNPYKVDSDFCPHFKDDSTNPLFYFVNVCPQCGNSFTEQFSTKFADEAKEKIYNQISRSWKLDLTASRNKAQAIQAYKLAIFCGDTKNETPAVLAGLCLRLGWIYRSEGNQEQEDRFLRLALKKYKEAYETADYDEENMTEMRVLYLIGELHRRLNEFQEAIRSFTMVIAHRNAEKEPSLVKMSREQWMEMRQKKQTVEEIPEDE